MTAETPTLWPALWHLDPGHGYLCVPLASCVGVRVSEYSFRDDRAGLAYLEEDCDAWAWAEAHPAHDLREIPATLYHDDLAPCRSLPRFDPTAIMLGGAP